MALTIDGLISQLDTTALVKKLIEIERRPTRLMQQKQAELRNKVSVWMELNTRFLALQGMVGSLKQSATFQVKNASSSNTSILTATASSAATVGSNMVVVNQLAQRHTVASDPLDLSSTNTPLSSRLSPGFATDQTFTITVDNKTTSIMVSTTATLNDLRNTINGAGAGVTASIIQDTPSTERLVITANSSGLQQTISFTDSADSVLQQLGVLTATYGQTMLSEDFNDGQAQGFSTLAASDTTYTVSAGQYQAVAAAGAAVDFASDGSVFRDYNTNYTFSLGFEVVANGAAPTGPALGVYLRRQDASNYVSVELTSNSTLTFRVVQGGTTVTSTTAAIPPYEAATGAHTLAITDNGSTVTVNLDGGAPEIADFAYTTTVQAGIKGVIATGDAVQVNFDNLLVQTQVKNQQQVPQDTQFTLDGLPIVRSSNTVSDLIPGVTLSLLSADSGTSVTVSVTRDTQAVQTTIQNFVDQYNSLIRFFQEQNFFNQETGASGLLIGDPALVQLEFLLQQTAFKSVDTTKVSELVGIGDGSRGVLFGQFALDSQVATLDDILEITVEGERFEVRAEGEALGNAGNKRVEVRTNGEIRFIDTDGSLLAIPDGQVIRASFRPGELVGTGDGTRGATLGDFSLDFPVRSASDVRGILLRDGVNDRFLPVVGLNQARSGQESFEVDAPTGRLRYWNGTSYAAVPSATDIVASYRPSSGPRSLRSLADLGISTIDKEDRQLQIDSGTLSHLLSTNPEGVENIFRASVESVAESLSQFLSFVTRSANGYISGVTGGLNNQIESLSVAINRNEEILKMREKRLFDQFNRMEVALGLLQAQQQFLLQQIQRLPSSVGTLPNISGGPLQ